MDSRKLKWKEKIFWLLLKNGTTKYSEIAEIQDSNGKKISGKVLWENLKSMRKDGIIEKIPSKERYTTYNLTSKYRTKEFDQNIYFNEMLKGTVFPYTLKFQHSVYGLPDFETLTEKQQNIAVKSIQQIEESMCNLKNISNSEIALLSTLPVDQTEVVRKSIELRIEYSHENSLTGWEDGLFRFAEIVYAGKLCRQGEWTKERLSVKKFLYHKLLNKYFKQNEIMFMLSLIKIIIKEYKDIRFTELDRFIRYKGYSENGLWYDSKNDWFHKIANDFTNSVDIDKYYHLYDPDKIKLIQQYIEENARRLRDDTELILFIQDKLYFEKIRSIRQKELAMGFSLNRRNNFIDIYNEI